MKGFVALVGAGPGEQGLLTVRGAELLSRAQVVVYDRLVSEEVLQLMPPAAIKINVGKENNRHPVKQEEINHILLQKAREGYFVVRLKGGDPFVFGRGGEELELLAENNIPFEVVPGITSAIAALCYAGIPATHRDYCSSVHIVTGHQREGKALSIPFKELVGLKGTLVFLMGISSLADIMGGLLQAGMDPETPAAVVENGTRRNQRKVIATVGTLEQRVREGQIQSPAIIAVGEVCTLSSRFDWFMNKPLFGRKVLVTRPKKSAGTLTQKLRELGAQPVEYPCIEIVPIADNAELYRAFEHLGEYGWILFSSENGVALFFDGLNSRGLDARALAKSRIGAVGSRTAEALKARGILADYTPEIFDGRHLAMGIAERTDGHEKVLVCEARMASGDIGAVFQQQGIEFDRIPMYDTVYTSESSEDVRMLIKKGELKVVTFTSASTVEGYVKSIGDIEPEGLTAVCIGEQTAEAAQRYNIRTVVAEKATLDAMIHKLMEIEEE